MAERRIRSATPSGKKPTPAQDALGLDQRLFHLAVGVITDFMFVGDMGTGRLDWYGDVDAILGYAPGEFPRTVEGWKAHVHPDDRGAIMQLAEEAIRTGQPFRGEYRIRTHQGDYRHWSARGQARDLGGEDGFRHWVGAVSDITEAKQSQQALLESERRARRFLDTAPDAVVHVGPDGTILFANERVHTVFGYAPDELIGASLETLIPSRFRQSHASHQHGFFAEPAARPMGQGMDLVALRKDGTEFSAEISLSSVGSGEDVVVSAAIRDVSSRIEQEKALRAAVEEIERLKRRLEQENLYLQKEVGQAGLGEELVGESVLIRQVTALVEQVAPTDATVLVLGETGTGKERVARSVHSQSARADHPLIKVNCATLPTNLIESALFGHEKGAFTGAISRHIGRFELAAGGTIFLDEIGDLPLELQPKLLRVLQEGEFERLGSSKTITVNARVIAATNIDLDDAVAAGKFRKDLYYRLQVFPITVPPLRQRRGDIPLLVWYLLGRTKVSIGRPIDSIPDDVMQRLVRYSWPGNVRELDNVIERAVILTQGQSLELEESFGLGDVGNGGLTGTTSARLEEVERAHILRVLQECGWRIKGKSNAAERLGLHPSTLLHRLKRLGIKRPVSRR